MEKISSVEFLKMSLQLLALQFPDIVIRYGLNTISTTMHVIELPPEVKLDTNKVLWDACFAIYQAFDARFFHEDMVFTSPDPILCIKELVLELNKDISESDRLCNRSPLELFSSKDLVSNVDMTLNEAI